MARPAAIVKALASQPEPAIAKASPAQIPAEMPCLSHPKEGFMCMTATRGNQF
jgi:hypothetical protein